MQNSKEYFETMDKTFKIKKNKMVEIQDGRYNSGVYQKMCPPYVWMPPVHPQHKERMLCLTKGVSICPHTFGPPILWMPPVCLDAPICLVGAPVCLDALKLKKNKMAEIQDGRYSSGLYTKNVVPPICLDAPCTYTTQRKHALSD